MSKSADSQKKILLADDSVTMHRAVSLALKKSSYELIYCDNGKDALRLIKENRPDVALLDLDMPELTGIEVAQKVREEVSLAHCQLVLLCGSFDEVNENEVEKAPVEGRLWKPFESHVLLTLLKTLIDAPDAAAGSSKKEQLEATEATSEQAPVFDAPMSRKTQAEREAESNLTEDIASQPSQASDIKKSVEPTQQQMRVEDLFNPATPTSPKLDSEFEVPRITEEATQPIPQPSAESAELDLPRNMAEETFEKIFASPEELNQELPPAKAADQPLPTEPAGEFPEGYAASPKTEEFSEAGSFWDEDEVTQTKTNVAFSEESIFPEIEMERTETNYSLSEEKTDPGQDFEVLSSRPPEPAAEFATPEEYAAVEATTEQPSITPPPAGEWLGEEHTKAATPELDDVIKASAEELSRQVENNLMRSGPGQDFTRSSSTEPEQVGANPQSTENLRALVREEVKRALNDHLKEELKRQLDIVLSDLERS